MTTAASKPIMSQAITSPAAASTAMTPNAAAHAGLAALASRYVSVADLPWEPTRFPGIEWKVLFQDEARGLMTALMRWAPGAKLPLHEHVDIEQTYVLEGSLRDSEGEAGPGEFVWRPAGSRHVAESPDGAVMLAIFQRPNQFFAEA